MFKKNHILSTLRKRGFVTTRQVAEDLRVSRNYAHILLQMLREEGVVILIGKSNQARYVLATDSVAIHSAKKTIRHIFLLLKNADLDESAIFKRIEQETGIFLDVKDNIHQIVRHGFTEMVNNAIDHSHSERVEIDCRKTDTAITFIVRDSGIGIFNNVREKFRLPGTLAAIQEILKGKATTDPKQHSGEGVFFTSKMADVFVIDSYEKRLMVNNLLPDIFISDRKSIQGTRVSFSIHLKSRRDLRGVFDTFTGSEDDGHIFDKTRITVKLFQFGSDLPSRSEAKRVTMNLENFKVIDLDFSGVDTVGQAFADEIFRVWQNRHPDIKIVSTNANENVEFMIQRAGGPGKQERIPI
jgi:anti-sigma regulatory factor (Ser/Thr protein kinase)/biotin operon repressor